MFGILNCWFLSPDRYYSILLFVSSGDDRILIIAGFRFGGNKVITSCESEDGLCIPQNPIHLEVREMAGNEETEI